MCYVYIYTTLKNYNFNQYNTFNNSKFNILDLVFSDTFCSIEKATFPLAKTDVFHVPLIMKTQLKYYTKPLSKIKYYNYKKANYANIFNKLDDIDWKNELNSDSININTNRFYEKIMKIIEEEVPKTLIIKDDFPKYFSKKLKRLIKIKKIYHKKYKDNRKSSYYYNKFKKHRKYCKFVYDQEYNAYLNNIEDNLKKDQKPYWYYVNDLKKNELPSEMFFKDCGLKDNNEIINAFADYFQSTFKLSNSNEKNFVTKNNEFSISSFEITNSDILKSIKKLKGNQSPGYNNIHPLFIKNCCNFVILPLKILFNQSIKTGTLPDIWKNGLIIPVFKNGDKTNIMNYRPITILSSFAKLLDQLVYDKISVFFNKLIIKEQHGSIIKVSTTTNLFLFKEFVAQALNRGNQVHTLYTDISKAFDSVSHKLLLQKLFSYGVEGNLLDWFTSYLSNRKQFVKLNQSLSKQINYISGVPQGSNLGPLLYIIYINDLKQSIRKSNFLLYVDDLKIFKEIRNDKDIISFKKDIKRLHNWNYLNSLSWNLLKCKIMIFDTKSSKKCKNTQYKIGKKIIEQVSLIKDLGIFFDENLNFNVHIQNIIAKAKKRIYYLKKILCKLKTINSLKLFYNSHIKSILMYGSMIWYPYTSTLTYEVEKIQHQVLRIFAYNQKIDFDYFSHNYLELNKKFDLLTLESSRDIADIKFLYRIFNKRIDSIDILSSINLHVPLRPGLRDRNILFSLPTEFKKNNKISSLYRIIQSFNMINKKVDITNESECSFIKSLKINLGKFV